MAQSQRHGHAEAAADETRLPDNEPDVIGQMRMTLRRRRYKFDTEKAYVGWAKRFLEANSGRELESLGDVEIRRFLSNLATSDSGGVSASTLGQAKSALLFLFRETLGREVGFLDHSQATKPSKLPVVSAIAN